MIDVSVIIPTLRRPGPLAAALASVFAQEGVDRARVEVLVVDNDRALSAREAVAALADGAPLPLRYVACPEPGVANARNAGVAAADGGLIAFLDDDQEASPRWLAELLATRARLNADVVFGPCEARLPDPASPYAGYFATFFSRRGPAEDQLLDIPYGCGNCLLVRATTLIGPAPFDARTNDTGGEDDMLFRAVKARGATFGWSARAVAAEVAPAHRATLRYTIARAFSHGQGPSEDSLADGAYLRLAGWMARGAVIAAGMGLVALALWLPAPSRAAWALDRAARGLGKVLFGPPFHVRFYGAAAQETATA